jgi:hypothetical protein
MFSGLGLKLYETWRALPRPAPHALPILQDVKATELAPVLAKVWIMRYQPPMSMIVRFVGTDAERLRGDTTGEDFLQSYIPPAQQQFVLDVYRNVVEAPCGAVLTRILAERGDLHQEIVSTILPLADTEDGRWSIMGVTEVIKQILPEPDYLDFSGNTLRLPRYVDIGYGLPPDDEAATHTGAAIG